MERHKNKQMEKTVPLLSLWGTGAVTSTLAVGVALVVAVYAIYLASTYLVARSAVTSGSGKKLLA